MKSSKSLKHRPSHCRAKLCLKLERSGALDLAPPPRLDKITLFEEYLNFLITKLFIMWRIEFNRRNYPKAYFDFVLRDYTEGYALDTNVLLDITPELKEFIESSRITLYPIVLHELFLLAKNLKEYQNLLNQENVRIVMYSISCYDESLRDEIKKGLISRNDAILLTYAKKENTCIISFDHGLNEVAFRHDIPLWDTRVEKRLPKKKDIQFKGKWKSALEKNTNLKVKNKVKI